MGIMRRLAIIFVLALTVAVVNAKDSDFIRSLSQCSQYSESGVVKTDGMEVRTTKQITGWSQDRCVYKETLNFSGIESTVVCKLKKSQINELVNVMNAYNTLNKYSNEKIDTSSIDGVKDNPVVKVWNSYLQDSSTCSITTGK